MDQVFYICSFYMNTMHKCCLMREILYYWIGTVLSAIKCTGNTMTLVSPLSDKNPMVTLSYKLILKNVIKCNDTVWSLIVQICYANRTPIQLCSRHGNHHNKCTTVNKQFLWRVLIKLSMLPAGFSLFWEHCEMPTPSRCLPLENVRSSINGTSKISKKIFTKEACYLGL